MGMTIATACLCAWLYLFFLHGYFWKSLPELTPGEPLQWPAVDIVVPARDEAGTIAVVTESLLAQDYRGPVRLILVDDDSADDTAARAGVATALTVVRLSGKPPGWSGKLWAVNRGVEVGDAPLLLLTDADIVHDPRHLTTLVAHLERERLGLISEMVRLNCRSAAERALMPAFVYFFQMLYPFAWVNDRRRRIAAAAGGTMLVRRDVLAAVGGIAAIKGALIDDVALAQRIKPLAGVYLGHSGLARSIRPYPRYADIFAMISRSAFTQLRYSASLLLLTVAGLSLVWLAPPVMAVWGSSVERVCAALACGLAATSYLPTLRRYGCSATWTLMLPLIASFYLCATVISAVRHWRGSGASWKRRSYG